ncbi:MAG TPA: hypothetical protein VGC66_02530 [Pyrinomonadaceae bacterium]|jgi:hypothetical protein
MINTRPSNQFFCATLAALKRMFHLFPPALRDMNKWDVLANCEHIPLPKRPVE